MPTNSTACSSASGSWTGSECIASDPTNQTGWDSYSAKDTSLTAVNGGADLNLGPTTASVSQTAQADFALSTNTFRSQAGADDFNAGAATDTMVAGGLVTLNVVGTSPVWSANTGWNTPDGGAASVPVFADMDGDGDLDIMSGFSHGITYGYKNTGTASSPTWSYTSAWNVSDVGSYSSPGIADLDNDGDFDLLVGQSTGFSYGYENTGSNTSPSWSYNSAWNTADIGSYARPRLVDLDNDGDYDLLQGSFAGTIYAYENTGTVSAPTWTAKSAWNLPDVGSYTVPEVGDLDGDGDYDVMIGDYNGVTYAYENTGDNTAPVWTAKTAWNTGDLGTLAAPGLADIDGDGDLDMFVGENVGISKAYENTGSVYGTAGDFVSSVIDTGAHSGLSSFEYGATVPANTTLSLDLRSGDTPTPDGSWTLWQTGLSNGADISSLGTDRYVQYRANLTSSDPSASPKLASVTVNFLNYPYGSSVAADDGRIRLQQVSASPTWTYTSSWNGPDLGARSHPRLVDMDDDGDYDMMVGDYYGYVFGVENTGSNSAPTWVTKSAWNSPVDVGFTAAADFADLDNDGDYDMILANSNGDTYAYENTGDKTSPVWTEKPEWWMLGNISFDRVPTLADLDGDGDYDLMFGDNNGPSYGYENIGSVTSPSWTAKSEWNAPDVGTDSSPAFADLDGDGDLDLLIGSNSGITYGYENTGGPTTPAWTAKSAWNVSDVGSISAPAFARLENDWDYDFFLGETNGNNYGYKNTGTEVFETSGLFMSSVIDLGPHAGLTSLDYVINTPANTSLTVDLRSGPTALPDGSWSAWQTGIANGGDISALPSDRYVQYRINLSTTNTGVTAYLSDISVNYSQYATSASLTSSAYNSGQVDTIINSLTWNESLLADTGVQLQLRTAADNAGAPSTWSAWVGPDGTTASFWDSANTHSGGCSGSGSVSCDTIPAQLRNTLNGQWLQYKLTLVSAGIYTPTLASVGVEYITANTSGSGSVNVSAISGSTTEAGGTATFTVVLGNAPTADVEVGIYSSDASEGTVSPAALIFTAANWSTPQTVTVTGLDEVLDDGDIIYDIVTGAVSSADANYDNINPADVSVTNVDDDEVGVNVTPSSGLITNEDGQTANFSLTLSSQPSADVTIGLSSSDTGEGTVAPASLTFTPSNWAVAQGATITGVNDAIIDFGVTYSIVTAAAVSSDPSYSGFDAADVSVINEDNDTPDIVVDAPYGLVTSESGGFAPFSITLSSAPTSNVTFMLSSSDSSEGFVSPFSMTFTPTDWNDPHTGTLFGTDDGLLDGDQSYAITTSNFVSADANFNTANPSDISVTNVDNDDYSVSVSPTSGLETTEYGESATFTIRLGTQPTSDVTITFTSSDPGEGIPTQDSITFTPSGEAWRGEHITISGVDDRDADGDQPYTIVLDMVTSDPNFTSINPPDVSLTNKDTNGNTGQHIENNIAGSRFGASVATADVNCDAIPDLVVGTSGQTYDEVFVYHGTSNGYNTLEAWRGRDTASNTDFGQRVFSVGDINKDGCEDIMVGATAASSARGALYLFLGSAAGLPDADGDGIGNPSDAAWYVIGDQTSANLGESLAAGDFNGDTHIDIAVSAPSYDNGQSNEGRTFVFFGSASGLPDANSDGIGLVSEAAWKFESDYTSGYTGIVQGLAAANVNGDSYDDLMIGVRGYTNGQSSEGRIFAFYGAAAGFNDAGADGLAKPSDADWAAESDNSSAYMSAVANADDLDGDGTDDLIVGAYQYDNGQTNEGAAYVFYGSIANGLPDADSDGIAHPSDAAWMVESNDTSAAMGNWVSSAGDFNNDGYKDVLVGAYGYSPSGTTVGGAFVYPGSAGGLSTTAEWTQLGSNSNDYYGRVVGLIGDVDNDGYSDIFVSADLYGTTSSGGGGMGGRGGRSVTGGADEGAVFAYLSNVQTPGITVTPQSGLKTTESGDQAYFSVVLDAPPLADVTIALSSDNGTEGNVSPTSLTFGMTDWMNPQTVTVTGNNDAITDGDVAYNIVLASAVSADSGYSGLDPADVAMTNIDNNVPQEVSVSAIGASESGSGSFTFTRSGEVTAALPVNYSVSGTATSNLDFHALSGVAEIPVGSSNVTVPVSFNNDVKIESSETVIASIGLSVDYALGTPSSATLTITDDDNAGAIVAPNVGLVTYESGSTDSFTVRLTSSPSSDVTVNLSSSDSGEALVTPTSLTFTTNNWNVDQTVTVVGQNDTIVDGDAPYSIVTAVVSSDANYSGLAISDAIGTNRDDDVLPTVTLSSTISSVNEGDTGNGAFTVTRTGSTTEELRIFYSLSGTANRSSDINTMSGTATILSGESSVSISIDTIQDDLLENDETVELTLAPGTDYVVALPSTQTVIIVDDDDPTTLPQANFGLDQTVGEGRSVVVTVLLSKSAQSYPVTIPYTVSGTATNPDDHDAAAGNILISSGTSGSATFNVVDDGAGEMDETILFSMGTPTNAQTGNRSEHRVTVTEGNEPAKLSLVSKQNGVDTRLVVSSGGNVTVTASVDDPNPGDNHSYDWSLTNNNLVDIDDADPATYVFNPGALAAGFYKVRLSVSDDGSPVETTTVELLLEVVPSAPALGGTDSDNDGIADNAESFDDSDGDGIADYLDPAALAANELQLTTADTVSYIMLTEPDLALSLGDVAFAAGADGAYVSTDDIAAYGGGEGDPGVASAQDTVVSPSGYFDFVVSGLPEAGQSVKVVIPQLVAIPGSPAYRKYDPQTGWRDFVVDADNSLSSAVGAPGVCPVPGDSAYLTGLHEGHHCIQLMIKDGGPNDTDGETNNIVEDPGSIIETNSVVVEPEQQTGAEVIEQPGVSTTPTSGRSGGGGGQAPQMLLLLAGLLLPRLNCSKTRVSSR